jgi:KDO2-lipid IV(A) lauroyltransferase
MKHSRKWLVFVQAWLMMGWMRVVAWMPLWYLRAWGLLGGWALYLLAGHRRYVTQVNLKLCFPQLDDKERRRIIRQIFVHFVQSWLDRAWIWYGTSKQMSDRVQIKGDGLSFLVSNQKKPYILFAPHFMGLDVAPSALGQHIPGRLISIYTPQRNRFVDEWVRQARQTASQGRLFQRSDGVRAVLSAISEGALLYLLPDMSFGLSGAVFVPFYGVPAATLSVLSRLSHLTQAQIVPVLTRLTSTGYSVEVGEPWLSFPSDDIEQDTRRMNHVLEGYTNTMIDQYYWVHRRFKDRPPGGSSVY